MFLAASHGPITRLRMASTLFGRPIREVSAWQAWDLLIDSGPPTTAGRLVQWCRGREIRRVLLTHHHEDHIGGAAVLREELGLPVLAPAPALPLVARGLRMPLYRKIIWRVPRTFPAEPLGEVVEGDGYRLRVIPTPGHAFSHVCLFDEERRWLFSGDLYVHERVRYLRRVEDVWQHIASLRRVLALGPELLICDHAGLLENACERLERKIRWWEDLAVQARELRDRGLAEGAITRRLLGPEGVLNWLSLGDFSHRNLIRSLLSSPPIPQFTLRSERLGFRCWTEADLELAVGLWGDAEVTRFIGGPFSHDWIRERLSSELDHARTHGVQYWPMFLLDDGDFVGCCGLHPYRIEDGIYELGYYLKPEHWGRGYASEAARTVVRYAFDVVGAKALFAGHHPDNEASRRLLQALGFRYTHHQNYPPTGRDHPSYLLTAETYVPAPSNASTGAG